MDFSDIAAVSGKGGLFKVVSPTRTGVILETLDGTNKKMVANMQTKVSILSDISIYTTDQEGAVPLAEVMKKIHNEFNGDTGLSSTSEPDELKSFLKFVLPEYDESRVYVSDIKKLVTWYAIIAEKFPETLTSEEPEASKKEAKEEAPQQADQKEAKATAEKKPAAGKKAGAEKKSTKASTKKKAE